MVIFTFIRHGQSTDNVKKLWAGWKDAPLSVHGMKQANALGTWFSGTGVHFTAILSSTLLRAVTTAEAVVDRQPDPKPPHIKSPLLREQHFGVAEGKTWTKRRDPDLPLADHYARGWFPGPVLRSDRFPEGESREDLAVRAEQAVEELLLPYILTPQSEGQGHIHIAVVSHGLFIREIIDALFRRDVGRERMPDNYRGLSNTGWTRLVVTIRDVQNESSRLNLNVRMTAVNNSEHLDNLIRQRGGIGSMGFDPKQKDIRGFFLGGASKKP